MKSNQATGKYDFDDRLLLVGLVGAFVGVMWTFHALGQFERSATPPLVVLILTGPACQYVAHAGVHPEEANGICRIRVRYRKNILNDGGSVHLATGGTLEISSGQVVGIVQLDDGSQQPWTSEHREAAWLLAAAISLLPLSLWIMSRHFGGGRKHEG
jgi:hypothetical protein